MDRKILRSHIETCDSCRSYEQVVSTGRSTATLRSRHTGRLAALANSTAQWAMTRALLAVVALQILVFSLRDLFWPAPESGSVHDVRHLAAFTLAYGMLLVAVVLRPRRAVAAVPAATVLAGALAITAVVDLVSGRIPLTGEILHIPEVLSVFAVRVLAAPERT